jgi:glycosyltransferase involved in cell wall biosynthesis
MRILVSNDGLSDVGGVQAYLNSVIPALEARGHSIAIAYCSDSGSGEAAGVSLRLQRFRFAGQPSDGVFNDVRHWAPDVCFAHNMHDLDVEAGLGRIAPIVKFMHGYFGTCVSGQKMHAFPSATVCDRRFGLSCAALFFPRRCGQASPSALVGGWRWAVRQQSQFDLYAAIVVASDHMKREFTRHGCEPSRVHTNELFPTNVGDPRPSPVPADSNIVFMGRMTTLKGGDLLIRATHRAAGRLGQKISIKMIGDGPKRTEWEALARRLDVPSTFTGWMNGDDRWAHVRRASVVALPSLWPEPFGLVGLEAGALGVPAVAVAAGGINQWLADGVNGVAVPLPADERTFGDALAAVLGDRSRLATLRTGAHQVAQRKTVAAHVERLDAVLQSVGIREKASRC